MAKTIIVPVDPGHSERAGAMLQAAKSVGEGNADIVLVSVIEEMPGYVAASLPRGIVEENVESAKQKLGEIANQAGIEATISVRRGNAANAILAAADENKADVIVIASHKPGMQDYFIGSTAARVVRHAKCSVYVLR